MALHHMEALQPMITLEPVFKRDGNKSDAQVCALFQDTDYTAGCGGSRTCSTPPGGKSWGCCDETSCYIPASCQDEGATFCDGTATSECPFSPIMSCTYGISSQCLKFVIQTNPDDTAKITSWGCGETPTTYILEPFKALQTSTAIHTNSTESSSTSSGLSHDATIILAVVLPVSILAILAILTIFFLRWRKTRKVKNAGEGQVTAEKALSEGQPQVQHQLSTEGGVHEMENSEWVHEAENNQVRAELEGDETRPDTNKYLA